MTATTRASRHRGESAELAEALDGRESRSPTQSRQTSPTKAASTSAERPVRKQLKNTSITETANASDKDILGDASSESGSAGTGSSKASPETESRGRRPKKKRSYDDIDPDTNETKRTALSKHLRKRSKSDGGSVDSPHDSRVATKRPDAGDEDVCDVAPTTATESQGNISMLDQDREPITKEIINQDAIVVNNTAQRPRTPTEEGTKTVEDRANLPISPQNKRSREEFANDHSIATKSKSSMAASPPVDDGRDGAAEVAPSAEEPERKRSREDTFRSPQDHKQATSAKTSVPSGFPNTAAQSSFGALAASKPPDNQAQTSSNAFASSGFASFAANSQSAFGGFGSKAATEEQKLETDSSKPGKTTSGFAALGGSKTTFASASSNFGGSNGFGSTSGFAAASGFGSTSGFGGLSNGFAGSGGSAPLASFASANGGGRGIIGSASKPPKPFGASAEDDEQEDGETSEPEDHAIKAVADDGQKDPRFFEQDVETGEEGEETVYSSRAKLYVNTEKQWKERSVGVFKVNVSYNDSEGDDQNKTARFIMRADGSHRISLNSPITKDIEIKDPAGGPPNGKNAIFLGFIDGKPKLMQLKMKTPQQTIEFYETVTALQAEL